MNDVSTARKHFIAYPTNCVVGTVADAETARTAIDALLGAGFGQEDIDILHGEEDLHRLDPTGVEHGFLAQFHRTLIRAFDLEEFKHLTHHFEDVRAGRYVIMVSTKRRVQRIVAADILNRHGAEFVGFHGRWSVHDLSAAPHASPEEIPAWFARAWNNRDANALAAMFDEDAEFVNASGVCWHDRESIRKGHADGLERMFNQSTLAPEAVKVKRLSPDVAVVHARMTVSGETPRATIVTFVVHRLGERWLCASVHNTDVMPNIEANVTNVSREPGVFRPATEQTGGLS